MFGKKCKLYYYIGSDTPNATSFNNKIYYGDIHLMLPETAKTGAELYNALLSGATPLFSGTTKLENANSVLLENIPDFYSGTKFYPYFGSNTAINNILEQMKGTNYIDLSTLVQTNSGYIIWFLDSGNATWAAFYTKNRESSGVDTSSNMMYFEPSTFTKRNSVSAMSMLNSGYTDGGVYVNMNYAIKCSNGVTGFRYMKNYNRTTVDYGVLNSSIHIEANAGDFYTGFESGYMPSNDPYADAGDSTTGGGDGTFDGSSDPVPVPSLPSVGATDTGFLSLFVPSSSQLKQVAQYLWGPLWDISTFKKLFEDPMDCILGLSVVPVSVPTSGNAQITVGNVELSGITLPLASQQYVELDCGTITFNRYFGSYLDFEPYTKMSLFVPYSGIHSVSADDIMGKTVGLKYHIDILTGSLVAFLTCGDSVLYEFNGACASNIPVNSINYASTIENAIRIAVNIGTTVATAGAAAPASGAVEAGKVAAGGAGIGRGIAIAGSTAEGALSLKPSIDRAGSLGGTTGLMGNQIPYFIITRPRMCKPKNQDFFQGYPSFIQTIIGDMEGTGFTAFENVIIADTYLTETEKAELSSILSAGVYL